MSLGGRELGDQLLLTYSLFLLNSFCKSPANVYLILTSLLNRFIVCFRTDFDGDGDWMQNLRPRPMSYPMLEGEEGDGVKLDGRRLW